MRSVLSMGATTTESPSGSCERRGGTLPEALQVGDLSLAEIREIWQFPACRFIAPKLMLRLEIAVFCWIGGKENFMLRACQRFTEGLILLGILRGADQDVPKTGLPKNHHSLGDPISRVPAHA